MAILGWFPVTDSSTTKAAGAGAQRLLRVFISYGRADATDMARRLKADLEATGRFSCWLDQAEMRGGHAWEEQIREAMRDSNIVVAVLTPHAVRAVTAIIPTACTSTNSRPRASTARRGASCWPCGCPASCRSALQSTSVATLPC
ncbi:MAG: toll/interleukin-1 receptor domain-containing protein [bacterium]